MPCCRRPSHALLRQPEMRGLPRPRPLRLPRQDRPARSLSASCARAPKSGGVLLVHRTACLPSAAAAVSKAACSCWRRASDGRLQHAIARTRMYQASGGACLEDPSGVRLRGRLCFEGVIGASVRSRTVGKVRPAPTFLAAILKCFNVGTGLEVSQSPWPRSPPILAFTT